MIAANNLFLFSAVTVLALYSNITLAACNSESAIEKFQTNVHAEAESLFTQCVESEESIAESNFYLGLIARNKKDLVNARTYFELSIANNPSNVIYKLELAVTLEWSGELAQALEIYQGISQEERNVPALLGKARMHHWMGKIDTSLAIYRDLLKSDPQNLAAKAGLGFALISNYELREAKDLFQDILDEDESNASALDGLKMLSKVKPNKLEVSSGLVKPVDDEGLSSFRLGYSSNASDSLRWGLEYVNYEQPTVAPNLNSISDNQITKNSLSAFANYQFNRQTSLFVSLAKLSMTGDSNKLKLQLGLTNKYKNGGRALAGLIPTFSSDTLENNLSYVGYVFDTPSPYSPMVQAFYNENNIGGTSTALSVSATRSYGDKNYFQIGGSVSRSDIDTASSAFFNITQYISQDTAITAMFLNNFSTKQKSFTLGITHEF